MKQYEYRFVPLEMDISGYSLLGGIGIKTYGHQEAIRKMGRQGWEYAGFLPVKQRAEGYISEIELIFKREISDEQ